MKKTIQQEDWVMLLADKGSVTIGCLCTSTRYGNRPLIFGEFENSYPLECKVQHLYLLSDEPPKKGEWCYSVTLCDVAFFSEGSTFIGHDTSPDDYLIENCKKIIATTNKSLGLEEVGKAGYSVDDFHPIFPQIPEAFVKHFAEKQGEVGEVEAEYEVFQNCYSYPNLHKNKNHSLCENCFKDNKLKLTGGEIIIHLPEENMNSYIFALSNKKFNLFQQIVIKEINREKAIQLAKEECFPNSAIKDKSIEEIHDMFFELGYSFESTIMVQGKEFEVTKF